MAIFTSPHSWVDGETITSVLFNAMGIALETFFNVTKLDSGNIKAAGVSLANLVTQKHNVLGDDVILVPGWNGPAGIASGWWASTDGYTLGLYFSGYIYEHTYKKIPAAMNINRVWVHCAGPTPAGSVQLCKNGANTGIIMAVGSPTTQLATSLDVASGDFIGWSCDGISNTDALPLQLGFSATMYHRS
jgi:hypothetical protein